MRGSSKLSRFFSVNLLSEILYCLLVSSCIIKHFLRLSRQFYRLNQKHKHAWINLLILLDELGDCNKVIDLADNVLAVLPHSAPVHSQIGTCYGKLGFFLKAQQHLLKAVKLQPQQQIHLSNLGMLMNALSSFFLV